MTEEKHALCLNCANIFFISKINDFQVVCPTCGFEVESLVYHKISQYSTDAVKYGYKYRLLYEKNLSSIENNQRYSIDLREIWTFIALAALSGIIGNMAYDLLKSFLLKVIHNAMQMKIDTHDRGNLSELLNEEQLKIFIRYIANYHDELRNIEPRVQKLIIEEKTVDKVSRVLLELFNSSEGSSSVNDIDVDTLKRLLAEQLLVEKHSGNSTFADIDVLWKNLLAQSNQYSSGSNIDNKKLLRELLDLE